MHKTFLFDCGNVLIRFSREHHLDVWVGKDPEDRKMVWDAVFTNWYKTDLEISTKEYFEQVKKELPERLHEAAGNIIFHWKEETWPVEGMDGLLKELKENGKQLILLSNMPDTFSYNHDDVEILRHFDALVFSYLVRMAKPNKDIFLYVLDKYNLKPEECLFVDDNEANIKTADELGIGTYLFDPDNPKKFIEEIRSSEF